MDATTLNTIVGIVGAIVGVIGIIIGVIGGKNISDAKKIINYHATAYNGSTIQQAKTIYNGLDNVTVIGLSRSTAQEEVRKVLKEEGMLTDKTLEQAVNRIVNESINQHVATDEEVEAMLNEIFDKHDSSQPHIYYGKEPPKDAKEGDIWFELLD